MPKVFVTVAALLLAGICRADSDVIFHDGKIVVSAPTLDVVEALAVQDGRVARLGRDEEIKQLAGPETRLIDLHGKTAVPGFYDGHVHLRVGPGPDVHDWTEVSSAPDLEAQLRKVAKYTPRGTWIRGMLGFEWGEDEIPDRWALDRATPLHPTVVTVGAHLMVLNSRALELARITSSTPDPPGGKIIRTGGGSPTGWLQGVAAWRPVWALVPWSVPDDATVHARIRKQLDTLLAVGITSANIAGVRPYDPDDPYRYMDMPAIKWIQQLYDDGNRLPRLTVQIRLFPGFEEHTDPYGEGADAAIRDLESMGIRTGFGDDRLKIGAVKLSFDGGDAGWTVNEYANRPGFNGIVRIPPIALYRVAKRAKELGWQLGIHTMGDAGVAEVVSVLHRIYHELNLKGQRDYLHHVSVLPAQETLDMMAALDIAVCSQPNFISFRPLLDALNGDQLDRVSPQRTLIDAGLHVGFGSDSIPYNPLFGIWSAVTRQDIDGNIRGAEEGISLGQALFNYTIGSAYLTGDERDRGSLEVGRLADMVVLTQDLLTASPGDIKNIKVEKTIIGGDIVYAAGSIGAVSPHAGHSGQ